MLNTLDSPFILLPGPPSCGQPGSRWALKPQHTLCHVTAATDPARWGRGGEYNYPSWTLARTAGLVPLLLQKLLWDL